MYHLAKKYRNLKYPSLTFALHIKKIKNVCWLNLKDEMT